MAYVKTRSDLRSEVLAWLDEAGASTTDTTYINANYALNTALVKRLTQQNWRFMLHKAQTFALVAGTTDYALHPMLDRLLYVYDRTARRYFSEVPRRQVEGGGFRWNEQSDGQHFALWGVSPVQAQPTSASVVTIVSSSAADTGSSKAITIYGDTADGFTSDSITPTGTTPAAGTVSFLAGGITGVTKGAAWTGTLTATANSAAVTVLKLFGSEYGRFYPVFRTLFTPTAANTLEYQFYRKPRPFAADNDVCEIPAPYENILLWDALLLMAAYDARLDADRVGIWRDERDTLEAAMLQAYGIDGGSIGSLPEGVRADAFIDPVL